MTRTGVRVRAPLNHVQRFECKTVWGGGVSEPDPPNHFPWRPLGGFRTTARGRKRAHLRVLADQRTPPEPREDPPEREKNTRRPPEREKRIEKTAIERKDTRRPPERKKNVIGRERKKARNFGRSRGDRSGGDRFGGDRSGERAVIWTTHNTHTATHTNPHAPTQHTHTNTPLTRSGPFLSGVLRLGRTRSRPSSTISRHTSGCR